ncbi:MAG: BBP7 family outer membrane beta-barrel protein [Casimicrobium sp.]
MSYTAMRKTGLLGLVLLLFVRSEVVFAQTTPPTLTLTDRALAPGQIVVGAEALLWRFKSSPTPVPLVTDGYIGEPNTRVLLGGGSVDAGANPALRITAGYGLTSRSALEANVFYIPPRSTHAAIASTGKLGSTDLVIPSIDAFTNHESITEISLAPIYKGSARVDFTNSLLGAEVNGVWAIAPAGSWKLDFIGGLRYLRLNEKYSFSTSSSYNPPFPPDVWLSTDRFETANHFYGSQVGFRARLDQGSFFVAGTVKVAAGAVVQSVDISGSLVTNDFTSSGATVTYPGAYFALPTNIGRYSRTAFAVVPEAALNVGYQITPAVTLVLGGSLLYANNVVRPGKQLSRTINSTQTTAYTENPTARLTGPALPTFQFNHSAFWTQGVSLGLTVRF